MGILDKIKSESQKSGASKGKFLYIREGEKRRIRFLVDMDEGLEVVFHDNYEKGINVPCREVFGKSCPYCEDEDLRTRSQFAWPVYDYEDNEVKIFMQAVNNCTAIPAIMALYETYGTLLDRDLILQRTGKQQNTTYAAIPMDKNKFRNSKVKPLSKKAILKYLNEAFPDNSNIEDDDDEDDELPFEDEKPVKKNKKQASSKKKQDEEESEYEDMSPIELYKLCKERGIECMKKKPEAYYINLLEEDDKAKNDWDDSELEDEDEDWDDEEWDD